MTKRHVTDICSYVMKQVHSMKHKKILRQVSIREFFKNNKILLFIKYKKIVILHETFDFPQVTLVVSVINRKPENHS